MQIETLSFARRHVLGEMHSRCDEVELVPVYLEDDMETQVGFADQSMGRYRDAFSFHLPSDVCKKLSSGQFAFSFGYANAKPTDVFRKPRVRLTYICLTKIKRVA